jgi:hypothetical protein
MTNILSILILIHGKPQSKKAKQSSRRQSKLTFDLAFWKTWFSISMLFFVVGIPDVRMASSLKNNEFLRSVSNSAHSHTLKP